MPFPQNWLEELVFKELNLLDYQLRSFNKKLFREK